MKILKLKNFRNNPDYENTVTQCVQTVDGMEGAQINLRTGEISYAKTACVDEKTLRDALTEKGVEVEE